MDFSLRGSTVAYKAGMLLSGVTGLMITLILGLVQVGAVIENGMVRTQFGLPFPWRETLIVERCSMIDCLEFYSSLFHWPSMLFDFSVFTVAGYLAFLAYWRLLRRSP